MAKVISPLFSFSASGQLAKSIVFFPWKGLAVVRQWVAPANPRTTAQVTHRGYMAGAVDAIHTAMVHATAPLNSLDKAAYATLASLAATPRTWFNQICKEWIDLEVLGKTPGVFHGGTVVPTTTQLVVTAYCPEVDTAKLTTGTWYYGPNKAVLLETEAAVVTVGENKVEGTITGLTNGVRYFMQFKATAEADWLGNVTGIYSGVPAA